MKKIIRIILTVLIVLIFFLAIYILISGILSAKKGKSLSIFGYSYSVVVSPSMEPTIMTDEIVIYKAINFNDVKVGDIIVFYNSEEHKVITHRVFEIGADGITTKGDNPAAPVDDFKVTEESLRGIVTKHSKMLGVGKLLKNSKSFAFIGLIIIFIGVIIYEAISIFKTKQKAHEEESKKELEIDKEALRKELLEEIEKENNNKKE